jgi:hypothetical protein
MKSGWAPILALTLAGCGRADVSACEEFLKDSLRSPSTYRRIGVSTYDRPINAEARAQLREEEERSARENPDWAAVRRQLDADTPATERPVETLREVFIEYDAENAFGAPIRGAQRCGFILRNGNLSSSSSLRTKLSLAQSGRSLRQLRGDNSEPAYPCCL